MRSGWATPRLPDLMCTNADQRFVNAICTQLHHIADAGFYWINFRLYTPNNLGRKALDLGIAVARYAASNTK
jgi:hypothetical protein